MLASLLCLAPSASPQRAGTWLHVVRVPASPGLHRGLVLILGGYADDTCPAG